MSKNEKSKNKDSEIPFTNQEIATATTGGVVTTANAYDYSEYAGQGFESHTRDDYAVPFLGVLQSNSPLLENNATARAGMIVNTVTNETYDGKKGVLFIPVDTQHMVIEWKPRLQGGGFVAQHPLDAPVVVKAKAEQEFGKYKTVKGDEKSNDLIETFSVYGIFVAEDGTTEQMIISFASTKIKIYKRWMTKARTIQVALPDGRRINPPLYAHKYRITSVAEKNAKGSFYNFNIDFDEGNAEKCRLPTNSSLFQAGKAFFELLKTGNIKAAYDTQAQPTDTDEEPAPVPFK